MIKFALVLCIALMGIATKQVKRLQVNFTLPQLIKIQQRQQHRNISLKLGQAYIHPSRSIQPLQHFSPNCHSVLGEIQQSHIASFPPPSSQKLQTSNYQHIYSQKYSTIFRLEHDAISAYRFSEQTNKLSLIEKAEIEKSHRQPQIVMSSDGEYLYYFSCEKVVAISIRDTFVGMRTVLDFKEMFYGIKVVVGSDIFVWASLSEGIRIYSSVDQQNGDLKQIQVIPPMKQQITDIALHNNTLYILTLKKSLHIYSQLGTGRFQPSTTISLLNICEKCFNRQFIVNGANIYIYSIEAKEQFVTELMLEYEQGKDSGDLQQVYFVRFFKGNWDLKGMSIYAGGLFLMYRDFGYLYKVNKDPRMITTLQNALAIHYSQILKLQQISANLFIKTHQKLSIILRLTLTNPYISCKLTVTTPTLSPSSSKPLPYIQRIEIPQPCLLPQNIVASSQKFYNACIAKDVVYISLFEESGAYHLFALGSVGGFCIFVVVMLVVWRKGKMEVITNLYHELQKIKKANSKRFEHIQFVQQKIQAKQSNWGDIHEQSLHSDIHQQQSNPSQSKSGPSKPNTQNREDKSKSGDSDKERSQQKKRNKKQNKSSYNQFEDKEQIQQYQGDDLNIQGTQRNMVVGKQ